MIVARERPEYDYQYLPWSTERHNEREIRRKSRRLRREYRRKKLLMTGAVLACFMLALFVSYYFAKVITLGYRITVTEKELAELQMQNEYLAGEIDRMSSLDRIEKVAKNELGMIEPGKEDIIMVAAVSSQDSVQAAQRKGDYPGMLQKQGNYLVRAQNQDNFAAAQSRGDYLVMVQNSDSCREAAQKPEIKKKNPVISAFAGLLEMNTFQEHK